MCMTQVRRTILYLTYTVSMGHTFDHEQCRDWIIYEFASVEAIIVAVELVLIARGIQHPAVCSTDPHLVYKCMQCTTVVN